MGADRSRETLRLLRQEFFPDGAGSALTVLQVAIWLVGAIGLVLGYGQFSDWLERTGRGDALTAYLWLTFATSTIFMTATAVLLQRLRTVIRTRDREHGERTAELKRQRQTAERAMKILHSMAEQVRRAAALREGYDMRNALDGVLGAELRQYLRDRLGADKEFHVTIKAILRKTDDDFLLADVFRDADQDKGLRPRAETEVLADNELWRTFKRPESTSQWIYVADTESLQMSNTLRERARQRGYRSVLAFPVNMAWTRHGGREGRVTVAPIVGLFGLDSPEPHAFDEFFGPVNADVSAIFFQGGGGSSRRAASDELNLFYGLADASATILMLTSQVEPRDPASMAKEAANDATPPGA